WTLERFSNTWMVKVIMIYDYLSLVNLWKKRFSNREYFDLEIMILHVSSMPKVCKWLLIFTFRIGDLRLGIIIATPAVKVYVNTTYYNVAMAYTIIFLG
ncbi:hypothetical protein L9F63_003499, partial [Diploptera punctata]